MKKSLVLLPLALLMMGNQQCNQAPQARELRRRVEMGVIEAPAISLPEGGKFDFKFVANAQMYDVLRKTQSFSTSTVTGVPSLDEMTQADRDAFNRCDDEVLSADQAKGLGSGKAIRSNKMSTVATCMINMPQAVVQGSITGFELTNAIGLSLDLFKPVGVGVSFDAKKSTLTMAFQADDPLIPNHNLAATTSKANRQEIAVDAAINFGEFTVGPKAYFKSSLATVVSKAMQNGINDLKQQMDQNSPWYAMVLKNCDKAILINAGGAADAGLQKGDVLEVYNVRYQWKGEVCDSTLEGTLNETGEAIAVAQVEIVGDTMSQAKIIEQTATKIQPGSRVYVRKLIQPTPPAKTSSAQKLATQK
jgi:hypothetical protein